MSQAPFLNIQLADYASRPRWPWRELKLGASFFVPFTKLEMEYPKLRTKRRKGLVVRAWEMGRYGLAFSVECLENGVRVTRVDVEAPPRASSTRVGRVGPPRFSRKAAR